MFGAVVCATEIRHLRYFLAVVEAGNYKLSASRLNIGQTSLERAMRALEVDLKTRLFVLWPRFLAPGLYDAIIQRCFSAGFTPRIRVEAPEKATAIALVAAGLGVTLTPASLCRIHPSEVAYRPIADAPFSTPIAVVTRRGERDPVIQRFLKLTQPLAEA